MIDDIPQAPVTLLLIGVTVALSLRAFARMQGDRVTEEFLFAPAEVQQGKNLSGMVLSQFAHADMAHLIFNMLTLFFFGPVVEQDLGPLKLVVIYGAAAVGSTLLTFLVHRNDWDYRALGASGAISGVLFAAIVLEPDMNLSFFFVPIGIPAPAFAIGYILASTWAARRRLGNIGHEAHIGGALTGLLFAAQLSSAGFRPLLERLRELFS